MHRVGRLKESVFGLEEMFISQVFWMLRTFFTAGIEIKVVFLIERVGVLMESGGIEVFGKIVIARTGVSLGKDFFFESQNLVILFTGF